MLGTPHLGMLVAGAKRKPNKVAATKKRKNKSPKKKSLTKPKKNVAHAKKEIPHET
jgi:hypothetical protein